MKKLLLTGAMLIALFSAKAQTSLYTENYDALTVGNVGSDLTGATAGQGGIFTYSGIDGQESDFQIVSDGFFSNGLRLSTGTTAYTETETDANAKVSWTAGIDDAWGARAEGEEIITIQYLFNSASVAGNSGVHQTLLYSSTGRVMAGFQYDVETGTLAGLIYYSQNGDAGTYTIRLSSATGGLVIPQNRWLRLGIAIDPSTGQVVWRSPDIIVTNTAGQQVPFAGSFTSAINIGLEPAEFDIVAYPGEAEADESFARYDSVVISAAEDLSNWLSTGKPVVADKLSVYPNPANNVINVAGASTLVSNVSIADLNGRVVKAAKFDGVANAQVNISDLASGVYMMTIASDKGTTTKKIVKN